MDQQALADFVIGPRGADIDFMSGLSDSHFAERGEGRLLKEVICSLFRFLGTVDDSALETIEKRRGGTSIRTTSSACLTTQSGIVSRTATPVTSRI